MAGYLAPAVPHFYKEEADKIATTAAISAPPTGTATLFLAGIGSYKLPALPEFCLASTFNHLSPMPAVRTGWKFLLGASPALSAGTQQKKNCKTAALSCLTHVQAAG